MTSDQPQSSRITISPGSIEEALNLATGSNGKLLNIECERVGKETGFISVITRAKLTWDNNSSGGLPESVIIKQPTTSAIEDVDMDTFDAVCEEPALREFHNRECDTYLLLTKFESAPPIPIPKCYLAQKRDDNNAGMLILEDFVDRSKCGTFNTDITQKQMIVLIDHVAKIQAYGFNCGDLTVDLQPLSRNPFDAMLNGTLSAADGVRKQFPQEFAYSDDELQVLLDECLSQKATEHAKVICLGDLQPKNILWKLDSRGKPIDEVAALVDFQLTELGSCMHDIGLVAALCMTPEDRHAVEPVILHHYLAAVKSYARKSIPLSAEEVKEMYRRSLLRFSLIGLTLICIFDKIADVAGIKSGRSKEFLLRCVAGIGDFKNEQQLI